MEEPSNKVNFKRILIHSSAWVVFLVVMIPIFHVAFLGFFELIVFPYCVGYLPFSLHDSNRDIRDVIAFLCVFMPMLSYMIFMFLMTFLFTKILRVKTRSGLIVSTIISLPISLIIYGIFLLQQSN